jgi:hypothetical protein
MMQTPWGNAETETKLADGMILVSTARHGGIYLGRQRWDELKREFPNFVPFGGAAPWLEEDCDAALAVILWPDCFSREAVYHATAQARASAYLGQFVGGYFTKTARGRHVAQIADAFAAEHRQLWQRGSLASRPAGAWTVYFSRGTEQRTVVLADYPARTWYTDAELQALDLSAARAA